MKINRSTKKEKILSCICLSILFVIVIILCISTFKTQPILAITMFCLFASFFTLLLIMEIIFKNEYFVSHGVITWVRGSFKRKVNLKNINLIKVAIITKKLNVTKYYSYYEKNLNGNYVYSVIAVEQFKESKIKGVRSDEIIKGYYKKDFFVEFSYNELKDFINEGFVGDIYIAEEDYKILKDDLCILVKENKVRNINVL